MHRFGLHLLKRKLRLLFFFALQPGSRGDNNGTDDNRDDRFQSSARGGGAGMRSYEKNVRIKPLYV